MNVVYITAAQITCLQNDVSRLETEKDQMVQERLHLEKERQMRSLLEEAARNQQTQKMEVDRLKTQVRRYLAANVIF